MYPKLKVRSQEQDVRYGGGINPSLPGLKALDSLFRGDFSSPAKKETKPTSKKLEAEVPSPNNLGSIKPLSASKDKNDRGGEEDVRLHIRASPIPRPRAVLSSPINDDMIGSKTKRRTEVRTSALKPHQCNLTTNLSASGRPKNGHEVSKEASSKTEIHKPRQLGQKCNISLKHSVAERLRSGREEPEEILNKKDIRGNKGSVATSIRIKE